MLGVVLESVYALHNTQQSLGRGEFSLNDESDFLSIKYLEDKKEKEKAEKQLNAQIPRWKTRVDRYLVRRQRNKKERKGQRIWIYVDSIGKTDNAWLQFLHDSQVDDGVTAITPAMRQLSKAKWDPTAR